MAILAFATVLLQAAFFAAGAWCFVNWGLDSRLSRKTYFNLASVPARAPEVEVQRPAKAKAKTVKKKAA
jgi:hypothetical protein